MIPALHTASADEGQESDRESCGLYGPPCFVPAIQVSIDEGEV